MEDAKKKGPSGYRIKNLDDDTIERIAASVARGNNREAAAHVGGISRRSLVAWLAQGRKDREADWENVTIYVKLLEAVEEAEDTAEEVMANALFEAAKVDAKYAVEWLKRSRKHRWSERVESTGADGGPVEHTIGNMTPEQIQAEAANIEARIVARVTGANHAPADTT